MTYLFLAGSQNLVHRIWSCYLRPMICWLLPYGSLSPNMLPSLSSQILLSLPQFRPPFSLTFTPISFSLNFPFSTSYFFKTPFLSLFLSLTSDPFSKSIPPHLNFTNYFPSLHLFISPLFPLLIFSLSSSCLSCTNLINFWQRHGKEKAKFSLCLFTPYSSFFSQIITSSSSHIHTGCPKGPTPCAITFEWMNWKRCIIFPIVWCIH